MAAAKENKHHLHFVQTKMQQDETTLVSMLGWIGEVMGKGKDQQFNGCFILTRKRAVFCRKGMMGDVFQAIPLDKITSVETLTRMGQRILTLHTSHDELKFKTFEQADVFDQAYNHIESLRHHFARPAAPVAAPAPGADTPLDRLAKLGALRDAGVVSPEEFETKKRELLAQI